MLTIEMMTIVATVLGLDLRVGLYPIGSALRDAGHVALLERLRVRLGSMVRWRTEVPVPSLAISGRPTRASTPPTWTRWSKRRHG